MRAMSSTPSPSPTCCSVPPRSSASSQQRAWYVGDSTWDMVAAVAAAMIPIGVTAGAAVPREALQGAGAAAVVADLTEIAEALR